MRIEMLETAASPEGVLHAGKVYDLPKRQAAQLLERGPHGLPYARLAPDAKVRAVRVSKAVDETDEQDEVEKG